MADQNTPRHTHDERLTEAQREQVDAAHHALQSRGRSAGDGGGVGAAGAVMAPMLIIGSFVVFMLYACFFPVAAAIALVTGVIVSKVFDVVVPGVGWIGHFMVMLPLAFGALKLFREHEWRLESKRGYVLGRHALRLVFTAVIVGLSITFVAERDKLRDRVALDESYSLTHFAAVLAAVLIVHFVGRWYDRQLGPQTVSDAGRFESVPKRAARRLPFPGMASAPAPLRGGLPAMTLAGGAFGAFLGYAAFETPASTLVGLFAGCIVGALLMFVCWLVTRPFAALFDRLPLLWPLLMGAIVGAGVAWRLALADSAALAVYLLPGVVGGALAFAVPFLLYAGARRLMTRPVASAD